MSPITQTRSLNRWFRRDGIKICFALFMCSAWCTHNGLFTSTLAYQISPLPSLYEVLSLQPPFLHWCKTLSYFIAQEFGLFQLASANLAKYGYFPTLWLFSARFLGIFLAPRIISQICGMLASTPLDPDDDVQELQRIKACARAICGGNSNGVRHMRNVEKQPMHCLCVRLVTRGDKGVHQLIYNAIDAAVAVCGKFCEFEHFKVHIVTQTQFLTDQAKINWQRQGATEVREIFVPPTYKSPKGSLYKARNIRYWQDTGGVGADCDEARSWVLSLDEEAVVLPSLAKSFINDVLRSEDEPKIGYALSPALIDIQTGSISFWTKMMEARFVAWHYTALKDKMSGIQKAYFFHGGAFFVRANVERSLGNDWGPMASVAEDFATGLAANERQVGFKYLNGWFIEGTSETLNGFIIQRARILRGQLYTVYDLPISRMRRFTKLLILAMALIFPFLHIFFTALIFILMPGSFMPAGPRCSILDLMAITCLTVQSISYIFGGAYTGMSNLELLQCILVSPFMTMGGSAVIDCLVIIRAFNDIFKEWMTGKCSFQITAKPANSFGRKE